MRVGLMSSQYVRLINVSLCLLLLLCTSCITLTAPNSARVEDEQKTVTSRKGSESSVDSKIVDTWELVYQINEKGDQELPRDSVRTLIEFTDRGQVIMNRINKGASNPHVTSKSGNYVLHDNELSITDDGGRSVIWPYRVTGDMLVISMPKLKKKFFLRRYR